MNIHLARNGLSLGVFSEKRVREGFVQGEFLATDLFWIEGTGSWRPLGELAAEWGQKNIPLSISAGVSDGGIVSGVDGTEPAWERRKEIGFFPAIFQTIKAVLFEPRQTFASMKQTGGLEGPLLYFVFLSMIASILNLPYALIAYHENPAFLALQKYVPSDFFKLTLILSSLLLTPVICALWAFLFAGAIHLGLKVINSARKPFETTFRVVCYTYGSFHIIRIFDSFIAAGCDLLKMPWIGAKLTLIVAYLLLVLIMIWIILGLKKTNHISAGKATLGVLLPWLFCCSVGVCLGVVMGLSDVMKIPHH